MWLDWRHLVQLNHRIRCHFRQPFLRSRFHASTSILQREQLAGSRVPIQRDLLDTAECRSCILSVGSSSNQAQRQWVGPGGRYLRVKFGGIEMQLRLSTIIGILVIVPTLLVAGALLWRSGLVGGDGAQAADAVQPRAAANGPETVLSGSSSDPGTGQGTNQAASPALT